MKILHIDDHPLFSSGLVAALTPILPNSTIFTAADAEQAFQLINVHSDIDLILLDLNMPGIHGVAFMHSLIEKKLHIPVALLSANEDIREIQQALALGAIAFLPKYWNHHDIAIALSRIEQGEVVIPDHIQSGLSQLSKPKKSKSVDALDISQRQLDVLKLMDTGLTNKEIADTLIIGESTVKTHVKALFQIFNCKNRFECVLKAKKLGVL